MNERLSNYLCKNSLIRDIKDQEIHVLLMNIRELDPDLSDVAIEMPADRYDKMKKYMKKMDRARHLGNELLFTYALEKYFGIKEDRGNMRKIDSNGKPYIECDGTICFNMSHSGDFSVCAFAGRNIGIDIEQIGKADMDIASRFFCTLEHQEILSLKEERRNHKFFEYWVLKESFVKAVGLGMRIPFNSFSFSEHEKFVYEVNHNINDKQYKSELLDVAPDYVAAVCYNV